MNILNSKYICFNIMIFNVLELNEFIDFLKKLKIDLQYLKTRYEYPFCFTFFTQKIEHYRPLTLYNSDDGEHLINGDFAQSTNGIEQYLISPIFNLNDFINYINNMKPNYTPKKNLERTLESLNTKYTSVVFKVNNEQENRVTQRNIIKYGCTWGVSLRHSEGIRDFSPNEYPIYIFAEIFINEIQYMTDNDIKTSGNDNIIQYIKTCNEEGENIIEKIFDYNDSYYINYIVRYGTYKPDYRPKERPKRLLESYNNKVLYVFDFDDTMVFSNNFEDNIKYLINERLTPENILKKSVDRLNVNITDLKYDNGRIYIEDENKSIKIPLNSEWVRKKDRIYLTQPESYYLTDESIPNELNHNIIDIYKSSENKAILTARKEKLRNIVLKTLRKFNIDEPNIGLYMYPNNTNIFPYEWKAKKLLELSEQFDEIHYYDDNIKLLKKIKRYLDKFNINIYLYKVMKNKYRLINEN